MTLALNFHPAGRHFLGIPGPSPVPDRILRAISHPTIDHRGPEFGALGRQVLAGIRQVFQTQHPVVIYPASGTGAWEAALSNTCSTIGTPTALRPTASNEPITIAPELTMLFAAMVRAALPGSTLVVRKA